METHPVPISHGPGHAVATIATNHHTIIRPIFINPNSSPGDIDYIGVGELSSDGVTVMAAGGFSNLVPIAGEIKEAFRCAFAEDPTAPGPAPQPADSPMGRPTYLPV